MQEVKKVKIHFFVNGKRWAVRFLCRIPKIGDKVRFSGDKYFTVKMLVWPMDEEECLHERCNIVLEKVA